MVYKVNGQRPLSTLRTVPKYKNHGGNDLILLPAISGTHTGILTASLRVLGDLPRAA